MSKLTQAYNRLKELGVFEPVPENTLIPQLVKVLPKNLSLEFKYQLVITYLVFFASNFKIYIKSKENDKLPVNIITWGFAPSGIGKDTAKNTLHKIFEPAFHMVKQTNEAYQYEEAQRKYLAHSKENPKSPKTEKDFLTPLPKLELGLGTPEGLDKELERQAAFPVGATLLYNNEISQALQNHTNIETILTNIAILYDKGCKLSKSIKDDESRGNDLEQIGLSVLFISSFDILYTNMKLREKLTDKFTSQFSRRSNMSITLHYEDETDSEDFDLDEYLNTKLESTKENNKNIEQFQIFFSKIATSILAKRVSSDAHVEISDEAYLILETYRAYNEKKSEQLQDDVKKLEYANLMHRHFQAQKIAGALAIIQQSPTITKPILIRAIQYTEIITRQFTQFRTELTKQIYEVFYSYLKQISKNKNSVIIPIQTLIKCGFLNYNRQIDADLDILLKTTNAVDSNGFIQRKEDNVIYTTLIPTDSHSISYRECPNVSKNDRGVLSGSFQGYKNIAFGELPQFLNEDNIFSPLVYKDNERKNANIMSNLSLLVLDIDNAYFDMDSIHELLKECINHTISTTSNKDNKYKYRIIFELDSPLEIGSLNFKLIYNFLAERYLCGIMPDQLPISQAFYSYKDSIIYSTLNKEKIRSKDVLLYITNHSTIKKPISKKDKEFLLKEEFETFRYAYECSSGTGSINLIRAINHAAKDLDADFEYCKSLVDSINKYWEKPMDQKRIEKQIYPHLYKLFGVEHNV